MSDDERLARIQVRLTPRAAREVLGPMDGDVLRVRVTAPPVEGRANLALVRLLAKRLGVARGHVAIVQGGASTRKVVEIRGLTLEQVRERVRQAR